MTRRSIIMRLLRGYELYLLIIVCVGLFFRVFQLSYGIPSVSHEEYVTLSRSWSMSIGDLNPGWFLWPGGLIYLQHVLLRFIQVVGFKEWSEFVIAARVFQVALGILTIVSIFAVVKRVYGTFVGLVAALFVAVSPQHIYYSRLARPETFVALMTVGAYWFALCFMQAGRLRHFMLSCLAVSLAFSVKYNGIIAIIIPFAAYIYAYQARLVRISPLTALMSAVAGLAMVFILLNPYTVLDYPAFLRNVDEILLQRSETLQGPWNQITRTWRIIVSSFGLPLSAVSCIAMILFIKNRRKKDIALLISIVATFGLIILWIPSARNILAGLLFLLIICSIFIGKVVVMLRRRLGAFTAIGLTVLGIGISVAFFVVKDITMVKELTRRSVTNDVNEWIISQVPSGSRIYWGFEATIPIITKDGNSMYAAYTGDIEPDFLYANDYAAFKHDYDYVILTQEHRRYLEDPGLNPAANEFYSQLYQDTVIVQFYWDRLAKSESSAPYFQILRDLTKKNGRIFVFRFI